MYYSTVNHNNQINVLWPCSCEHCKSVALELDSSGKYCTECKSFFNVQNFEVLPSGSLRNVCRTCKAGLDKERSKGRPKHQRDTCPKCLQPKMIESKLCRACYKQHTQAEHRKCSECQVIKSTSQFEEGNSNVCFQCQKKMDRVLAKKHKEEVRAAASICSCGNPKLPESQRCRTCGAALAGAAKLAKMSNHAPIEMPRTGLRGRKPHPMRNPGDLKLVMGYKLTCMLCSRGPWLPGIPKQRVRCECGGSYLAEPESRKVWD